MNYFTDLLIHRCMLIVKASVRPGSRKLCLRVVLKAIIIANHRPEIEYDKV